MRLRILRSALPLLLALPLAAIEAQLVTKDAAPDPKAAVPPPKMWAAQVTPTQFDLVWGRVARATGYELLVRNASGQLVRLGVAASNATRWIVPTATLQRLGVPVSEIQFAIRALVGQAAGELGLFNPVSLAKQSTAKALVVPTNAAARESSPGVITVTWDEVDGATAYAIGRLTGTSGFQRFCELCPTGGALVDTVPTAGTRYAYSITAVFPGGRSRPAQTGFVEVARLATDGGGGVVATGAEAPMYDIKGLAEGVSITARPIAGAVVQLAVGFAMRQGGVTAEVVRRVCNGPLRVIRTIADLAPFNFDDRLGGLDFPECAATTKVSAEYFVRIRDPKGAVAQSKAAIAEVATVATADTSATGGATALDPKGLAAGITVTPRVGSGGGSGILGMIIRIARSVVGSVSQTATPMVAHLMRQVCNGPWIVVRPVALDASVLDLEDAVDRIDSTCGTGKYTIRYAVRVSDPKGLVATSAAGEVEVPATVTTGGAAALDPKGLAAGITVTPRLGSDAGSRLLSIFVQVATPLMGTAAQTTANIAAQLMRQVCEGPWTAIRPVALDATQHLVINDAVEGIDVQCGTSKRVVRYHVRVTDPKGLAATSPTGEVEVPATVAPTSPPATPGNRQVARISDGTRTLTWSAVPTAEWYRIERVAGAKGAWTVVAELPGTATSWKDSAVPAGEVLYRITAGNRAGNSATGNFP